MLLRRDVHVDPGRARGLITASSEDVTVYVSDTGRVLARRRLSFRRIPTLRTQLGSGRSGLIRISRSSGSFELADSGSALGVGRRT